MLQCCAEFCFYTGFEHVPTFYVSGIAISKDGVIYVADGPNIRRITPNGIISTLIGSQEQPRDWTPMPCDDILSAERVSETLCEGVWAVICQ